MLLCPQFDTFLPIHLEYYPAFAHKGFAYVPGTSVAKNRSFQALFRAPLEEAHKPAAWQVYQHGSVWHDEPVTNEALGIWGQTLSGQVDPSGRLRVMFPCKDRQDLGTINLAGRDWNRPYRDGFVLSAPRAPAVAILQRQFLDFQLRLKCSAWPAGGAGATGWGVSWQCRGPVGTGGLTADSRLSALMRQSKLVLRVLPRAWRLLRINAAGAERLLAQGPLAGAAAPQGIDVCIRRAGTKVQIDLGGTDLCSGQIDQPLPGRLELEAQAGTILKVSRFQTTGQARAGTLFFLGADAVAGAAEGGRWKEVKDPLFRFGAGYQTTSGRAKWNYYGGGFKLHCPRGPAYGACKVIVDGKTAAERIELNAPQRVASAALLDKPLPTGLHAVVILPVSGTVAIDCLEVQEP